MYLTDGYKSGYKPKVSDLGEVNFLEQVTDFGTREKLGYVLILTL